MKNEEIVKALRRLKVETGSLVCMGCGCEHDCGILGCRIVREAAELIERLTARCTRYAEEIAVAQERTRWVPVEERLPEDRRNVLIVADWLGRWGFYMGWYNPERAEWSIHVGIRNRSDVTVVYWMPLPELPEEVE